jgi:creatinine amidohydrolase
MNEESKLPSKYWSDWTSPEFASLDPSRAVAVIPLGATEQHGPHLPLSVDAQIVNTIVKRAVEHLSEHDPILVLPTQAVGLSTEHIAYPGTLTWSPELVMRSWTELGECVARAGIKKLLFFNAHGGHQGLMDVVARELRQRAQMIVYSCSWYQLPMNPAVSGLFSQEEHRFGVHAGAIETSMMLSIDPEHVKPELFQNFTSRSQERSKRFTVLGNGQSAKLGWHAQDYNPLGATGDASAASLDKGEQLLNEAASGLKQLLLELIELPLNTISSSSD